MRSRILNIGLTGLIYTSLAFPLFYFVYKFGNPEPIAHDFFQYYRLYRDMDFNNVIAPLNMRLAGAFVVNLFYNAGLSYNTQIAFDAWAEQGFEKPVFFCAVFFNFLCVSATCLVLFRIARRYAGTYLSFCAGLLYLFGFGTVFYGLMPLTDAFSILLFALFLYSYLKKSYVALLPLLLLILQREYLILAIFLISLLDFITSRSRYHLYCTVFSILCFAAYFILRKTVFYNSALDFQTRPESLWKGLTSINFPIAEFVRQTFLTMNLVFVYLGVVLWKRFNRHPVNGFELLKISLLFVQVNLLSFAGVLGNNNGRYFYMVVPLIIVLIIREVAPILQALAEPQPSGKMKAQ
jgi:hypothetical protein